MDVLSSLVPQTHLKFPSCSPLSSTWPGEQTVVLKVHQCLFLLLNAPLLPLAVPNIGGQVIKQEENLALLFVPEILGC